MTMLLVTLTLFFVTAKVQAWTVGLPGRSGSDQNQIDSEPETYNLKLIFPGTKWCGSGNAAANYDDLGTLKATDACCREHDNCPDIIESGESAHGLSNPSVYTRLHCQCDEKFLSCLRASAATERTSEIIGLLYFDALHTQCYREDYPVIGCTKYSKIPHRCQEYAFDRASNKKSWQWFDVPLF